MILPDKTTRTTLHDGTTLPLLPVRDIVVFPSMMLPLAVKRDKSIRALEAAMASHRRIFLAAQKQDETDDPQKDEIYSIGTVAEILQLLKMPDGILKILVEGRSRGRVLQFTSLPDRGFVEVEIEPLTEEAPLTTEIEALQRQCTQLFDQLVKLDRRLSIDAAASLNSIDSPARLADMIASHLLINISEKQALLETVAPKARLERLVEILTHEVQVLNIQRRIDTRVRSQIEKTQREYYLNEQMKAIQKELRQKDDHAKELDELREKITAAKMSKEATEIAEKEVTRLEKMMPFSPEATVIRTYLDWLVSLPWSVTTQDNLDIKRAQTILDQDHYGLEKPKERVTEYLAVLKLVKKIKGPILCFVGPPGVGKTSIARSVATAMGRNFAKMSLGGVRDEAEIRGHRRTYIGSLPGHLIRSLAKAKSRNPVFLLDEIDKMGMDWRGDPAAALLEVLDPEQNRVFMDHFLDVEFDLSDVLFICTANSLEAIPATLRDRLEIIRFSGYTESEKFLIAKKYLIPKQLQEHGIPTADIEISDTAIHAVIHEYTREAGVRSLERQIATLCRKTAKVLVTESAETPFMINDKTAGKLLGVPEFSRERAAENTVGVSTGLAWTEHGGELLGIEVVEMPGKGKLLLTGKLGDVMRESAQAALSFIRANAKKWQINTNSFTTRDYHIHVPEGATPKDGPSAGIAMATALISAMTGRAVKKRVAMTGEITLQGRVLPIGGLKEKSIAAYREGMDTVLYPEGNRKDLGDIPDDVKKHLKMIPLKHMDEVWSIALEKEASMKKQYLITPGPTPIPPEVSSKEGLPILHHRTNEFGAYFEEVVKGLKYVFMTQNDLLLMTCSGTGAMESAVANLISSGDTAIVASSGAFGERWGKILERYGAQVVWVREPEGQAIVPARVEEALKQHPTAKAVYTQHTETSTGVVNDVRKLGEIIAKTPAVFVLDAISGLAGQELRTDDWKVDVVVSGSQKGLMTAPGLAMVSVSQKAWKLIEASKSPRFYFDYRTMLKSIPNKETPYTPAVTLFVSMAEALRQIKAEGIENIWARHAWLANATREGVKAMGLTIFAQTPCNVLTSINVPAGIDGKKIVKRMREEYGVSIAGGQVQLEGKIVRLAHMGYMDRFDVIIGLSALEMMLHDMGFKLELGKGVAAAQRLLLKAPQTTAAGAPVPAGVH